MAKVSGSLVGSGHISVPVPSLRSLALLRLILGMTLVVGTIITLNGFSWDGQWHALVGRDRTLIAPHLMILTGLSLSGFTALVSVLIETVWTRRHPHMTTYQTNFAGWFNSSLGAYVAGYLALVAAIAFPLDQYWHALYGIDLGGWTPFHVMFLASSGLIPLGAAYMLASAAHLAEKASRSTVARTGYIGMIVALATMMMQFTILLSDGLEPERFVRVGGVSWTLFPLLTGMLLATIFVTALKVIPRRAVATSVTCGYIGLGLLFMVFVPAAMSYLVTLERLSYRPEVRGIPTNVSLVTMLAVSLTPLIVAPLIDICFWQAQRRHWSRRRVILTMAGITIIACVPVVPYDPLLLLGGLTDQIGLAGSIISLLLGGIGTFLGAEFGLRMSETMQRIEGGAAKR